MADLSSLEKLKFEKFLGMGGGYVLDFSNRTFEEFFHENAGVDIYQSKYDYASGSKANRLRAFWNRETNVAVGKFLSKLLEYWKLQRELNKQVVTLDEQALYEECKTICERLSQNTPVSHLSKQIDEKANVKKTQLELLFKMFEELAISTEHQKRGFLLQDLLNRLFLLHEIPVTKSFQRNSGGEQIDGAFYFDGWHYLVECKWTQKLADIKELDSLLGKINRSGKQAMGLFLSIDGWSENVPSLLKQNPEKCIILMEGYDLRCVLSGAVEMERLLKAKIARLNLDAEPYLSVVELLRE